jgi:hypothetical protein
VAKRPRVHRCRVGADRQGARASRGDSLRESSPGIVGKCVVGRLYGAPKSSGEPFRRSRADHD